MNRQWWLSLQRKQGRRRGRQHFNSRGRRAAFERLEGRYMLDGQPTLSISSISLVEGFVGSLVVTLSEPSNEVVTVDFSTMDYQAEAWSDYSPSQGSLTFYPGDVEETITVDSISDTGGEPPESYRVLLTNATNAEIVGDLGIVAVHDAPSAVAISDSQASEGTEAIFILSVGATSFTPIYIEYSTVAQSAGSSDFEAVSHGSAVIPPWETSAVIIVRTFEDAEYEGTETFRLVLESVEGGYAPDPEALGTIDDNSMPDSPRIRLIDPQGATILPNQIGVVFPNTTVGIPNQAVVTIANDGPQPLYLDDFSILCPPGFSVITPFANYIPSGQTSSMTLQFDGVNAGRYEGELSFNTNDPTRYNVNLILIGEAWPVGFQNSSPTVVATPPSVYLNEHSTQATIDLSTVFSDSDVPAGDQLSYRVSGTSSSNDISALVNGHVLSLHRRSGAAGSNPVVSLVATDRWGAEAYASMQVYVSQPALTVNSFSITAEEEIAKQFHVATFSVPDAGATADEFVALVDWGDGNQSTGEVASMNQAGNFSVNATHAYSTPGSFPVSVSVRRRDGSQSTSNAQSEVSDVTPLVWASTGLQSQSNTIDFEIRRVGDTSQAVALNYITSNDTSPPPAYAAAIAGVDYESRNGIVFFSQGQTTAYVSVPTISGAQSPPREFLLYLSTSSPGTVQLPVSTVRGYIATAPLSDPQPVVLAQGNVIAPNQQNPVQFSTGAVGQAMPELPISVRNIGNAPLTVSNIVVPAGFQLKDQLSFPLDPLEPGRDRSLTLQMSTSTSGNLSGNVNINFAGAAVSQTIPVSGAVTLAAPEISVSRGTRQIPDNGVDNVGTLSPNTSTTLTYTVRNDGGANLFISPVSLITQAGASTVIIQNLPNTSLVPGGFAEFKVRLTAPAQGGTVSGTVSFVNSDSNENPYDFVITATSETTQSTTVSVTGDAVRCENGAAATLTFSRTGPTTQPLTVWFTASGQGVSNGDFQITNAQYDAQANKWKVTIPAGQTAVSISLTPFDDFVPENDEVVNVSIVPPPSGASYSVGSGASVSVTIQNNDADVRIADSSLIEGNIPLNSQNPPERKMPFTVSLTKSVCADVQITYQTQDGNHPNPSLNAVAPGDYRQTSGVLTIPRGTTSARVDIGINGDAVPENDEGFYVNISTPTGGGTLTLADAQAVGTIVNDDILPSATLSIDNVKVTEGTLGVNGNQGYVTAIFTVSLSQTLGVSLSVSYATADGDAKVVADYVGASGALSFAAGQTSRQIQVQVVSDAVDEWNEEFFVNLSNIVVSGASVTFAKSTGVGTIIDDDSAGENGQELKRILHKEQCTCSCACESDGLEIHTKDGGFSHALQSPIAPSYFHDSTFSADMVANFVFILPSTMSQPDSVDVEVKVIQDDGATEVVGQGNFTSNLVLGSPRAFAVPLSFAGMRTGAYRLDVTLTARKTGNRIGQQRLTEAVPIFNLADSYYGQRWWFPFLDRIAVASFTESSDLPPEEGVALFQGNGIGWWFKKEGLAYKTPDGLFATLTKVGNVFRLQDKFGVVKEFDDSDGLLKQVLDNNGNATTFAYQDGDNDGTLDELKDITDPFNRKTQFFYDSATQLRIVDFVNRTTTLNFDSHRQLIAVAYPPPVGALSPQETFSYDALGRLVGYTDANHATTSFAYDSPLPRSVSSTKADGSKWMVKPEQTAMGYWQLYNPNDAWAQFIDGNGTITKFKHDDFGNAISVIDANQSPFVYDRNKHGLLIRAETPAANNKGPRLSTSYQYDNLGNLTTVTYADGSRERWRYSTPFSRVTQHIDEVGRTADYTIDNRGNATSGVLSVPELAVIQPHRAGNPAFPWQNPVDRIDVNNDGFLTSIDSLIIINEINQYGSHPLAAPGPQSAPPPYFDVTGDGFVTPSDALEVMNLLNGIPMRSFRTEYVYSVKGAPLPGGGVLPGGLLLTERQVGPNDERLTKYAYQDIVGMPNYGRLTQVTRAPGTSMASTVNYQYDLAGNITTITDELGRTVTQLYDGWDRLIESTSEDPDAPGTGGSRMKRVYAYNDTNDLLRVEEWERPTLTVPGTKLRQTSFAYDALGRVTERSDPAPMIGGTGAIWEWKYDKNGNLVQITTPGAAVTSIGYDVLNRVTQQRSPAPTSDSPDAPITSYQYDALGNLIRTTNPNGNPTTYEYDSRSRLTKITEPAAVSGGSPVITTLAYNLAGDLTRITDPLSRITDFGYDLPGRQVLVTTAAGSVISAYDAFGNLSFGSDRMGNWTKLEYDALDRITRRVDPDPDGPGGPASSPTTLYGYQGVSSQLISATDPLGGVTQYQFDNLGRLIQETRPDPDGAGSAFPAFTAFAYDTLGNITKTSDALGQEARYTYDLLGRVTEERDALNGLTTYEYDSRSNMTKLTDPVGNTTSWQYDRLDRVTSETIGTGGTVIGTRTFSYDKMGNLLSKADRNDRRTEYVYDRLNRRTQEKWKSATGSDIYSINYSFDAAGQLTSASDQNAVYAFGYDAVGRLLSTNHNLSGAGLKNLSGTTSPSITLANVYDANGNRTKLSAAIQLSTGALNDFVNNYGYDRLGRTTSIEQKSQATGNSVVAKHVDLTYDGASQLKAITRFESLDASKPVVTTAYDYDAAGRISALVHTDSPLPTSAFDANGRIITANVPAASLLGGYTWTWDRADRPTAMNNLKLPNENASYQYDARGQLTGATYESGAGAESYSYDSNGNRTGGTSQTGVHNRVMNDGTFTYTYDKEGNRTERRRIDGSEVYTYTWDHRNRLTGVVRRNASGAKTMEATYLYDSFDRRVAKSVDPDGGGALKTTKDFFVYDGDHIALQFQDVDVADATPPKLTHRYLHGPRVDMILADERIDAISSAVNTLWPLADHLGTVRDLVDVDNVTGNRSVVSHRAYDSFGKVTLETGAVDFLFGFTGRERDKESGLYYYRARYYDPRVGRFLSEDTIWDGANNYAYVGNSPMNHIDPSGLAKQKKQAEPKAGANSSSTPPDFSALIAEITDKRKRSSVGSVGCGEDAITLLIKLPGNGSVGHAGIGFASSGQYYDFGPDGGYGLYDIASGISKPGTQWWDDPALFESKNYSSPDDVTLNDVLSSLPDLAHGNVVVAFRYSVPWGYARAVEDWWKDFYRKPMARYATPGTHCTSAIALSMLATPLTNRKGEIVGWKPAAFSEVLPGMGMQEHTMLAHMTPHQFALYLMRHLRHLTGPNAGKPVLAEVYDLQQ